VNKDLTKRYLIYLLRWQLSTPILAPCVNYFAPSLGTMGATALANLIGGLLFFWWDRHFVFKRKKTGNCTSCGEPIHEIQ
jgi:hypothetical protein